MPLSFCCIGHALLRPGLLKYIVNPTITYSTVIATANTLILCRLIVPRLSFCLSPSLIIRHGLTGAIFRIIGMRSQRRNGDLHPTLTGLVPSGTVVTRSMRYSMGLVGWVELKCFLCGTTKRTSDQILCAEWLC